MDEGVDLLYHVANIIGSQHSNDFHIHCRKSDHKIAHKKKYTMIIQSITQ